MSMNIRWNFPAFHLLTASRPLAAVSQRTFSCCICFETTRETSELSSAIRTLIGGIAPSSWTRDLEWWSLDDFGFGSLGGFSPGSACVSGLMLGGRVVKGRPIREPGRELWVVVGAGSGAK